MYFGICDRMNLRDEFKIEAEYLIYLLKFQKFIKNKSGSIK